jgi:spore cortex formation protein SpoVR/YcgB (stage V sporulation)
MTTPGDMLDALEELNLKEVVLEAIEDQKQEYLKLNLEQLYEGKGSDGDPIEPEYASFSYAQQKNYMNPTPGFGTPDLKVTGAFYEGMEIEVDEDELTEESPVEYAQYLDENYGENQIYGLTPDNHQEFVQEILQPLIVEKVSELTGLK